MKSLLALIALLVVSLCTVNKGYAEGVVALNMDRVFAESDLVKNRSEQMRSMVKEIQDKIKAMDEEIKVLETEVNIRPPTHPRYGEFREQLEVAKLRRDLYRERQGKRIGQKEVELLKQSYQDMQQLVGEYGKEQQHDFIMLLTVGDFPASSVQSLRLQIGQRGIIYANPEKDITDAFIAFANSRVRGKEEATTTPTPGAP